MCDTTGGPSTVLQPLIDMVASGDADHPEIVAMRDKVHAAYRTWMRQNGIDDDQVDESFIRGALTMLAYAHIRQVHVHGSISFGIIEAVTATMDFGKNKELPSAADLDALFKDS